MTELAVGFTGTQHGCTLNQAKALQGILIACRDQGTGEFHHGDCTGADDQAHHIAWADGWRIVVHPPTDTSRAMGYQGHERRDPKPYLERDDDIAHECAVLIACPDGPERVRSGTWATVRRGRKHGRRIIIIWPDGTTTEEPAREAVT